MRRISGWMAALPLVLSMSAIGHAGIFCGGCSDPCGNHRLVARGCFGGGFGGCFHRRHSYTSHWVYSNAGQAGFVGQSSVGYLPAYGNSGVGAVGYGAVACGTWQDTADYGYRGEYSLPTVSQYVPQVVPSGSVPYENPSAVVSSQISQEIASPITSYQVTMVPTYATETQYVATTEYQEEKRFRVKKVYRTIPVEEQKYRTRTVMTPRTETKTIEYAVLIPETSEKTVEVTTSVPVWNEVSEPYTVKIPYLVDVQEPFTVRVPTLRDESFTYTVQVPTPEKVMRTHTVTNSVPVTKTRTVQRVVPRTSTKTVQKDYGHWETVVDETSIQSVPMPSAPMVMPAQVTSNVMTMGGCGTVHSYASIGQCTTSSARARCGRCGCFNRCQNDCRGCGSLGHAGTVGGCGVQYGISNAYCGSVGSMGGIVDNGFSQLAVPQTRTRRVWVPNVVAEEVPVIENTTVSEEVTYTVFEQRSEQVPYEHTVIAYRPETRTGTKKVVDYVDETRTRTRKQVEYREETRNRVRKELSYRQETKNETYPVVSYRTENRTKEISYTIQVPEVLTEPYTTTRYEQVAEDVIEEYSIRVPAQSYREVQVQVCKMIPKLVPVTIQPRMVSAAPVHSPNPVSFPSATYPSYPGYCPPSIGYPSGSMQLAPSAIGSENLCNPIHFPFAPQGVIYGGAGSMGVCPQ